MNDFSRLGPTPEETNEPAAATGAAAGASAPGVAGAAALDPDRLVRLADGFDRTGEELRERAGLGQAVLADPAVADSAALSPRTFAEAEQAVHEATTGGHGLIGSSLELDADALIVRATALTYRWLADLQEVAYRTIGSVAARAVGYLAPEVSLGGAVVTAGLIETDVLDRDGVAAYLSELAESNPALWDHLASGGGSLLDALQLRALLTAPALAGDQADAVARAGLAALRGEPMPVSTAAALRDSAAGLSDSGGVDPAAGDLSATAGVADGPAAGPGTLEELVELLQSAVGPVSVVNTAHDRYLALLPGTGDADPTGARRLVGGGPDDEEVEHVASAVRAAVATSADPRLMLVGAGAGGVLAAHLAAQATDLGLHIDHVVVAGAPGAQVPQIPESTRVLSLEDNSDPVALLGSLLTADEPNRLTVVFDGADRRGAAAYTTGARAADNADHPELRSHLASLREDGYLAPVGG